MGAGQGGGGVNAPSLSAIVAAPSGMPGLSECLDSIDFAQEKIVLTSEDGVAAADASRATGEWLLFLDADMRVPPDLRAEIAGRIAAADGSAYAIPIRNFVGKRWIRHGRTGLLAARTPPRLVRRGVADAAAIALATPVERHLGRGVSDLLRRLDRETTARARVLARSGGAGTLREAKRAVCARFFEAYFTQGGFRDGRYGLAVAICAGLDPVIAHLKAALEESPAAGAAA